MLAPTPVQGPDAVYGVVGGIETLNRPGDIDVIIVARGGGSVEELWAFNEEPVARAVFGSLVPVVSAVGHETDFTICDYVADLRAPTPSAAAELVAPDRLQIALRSRPRSSLAVERCSSAVDRDRAPTSRRCWRAPSAALSTSAAAASASTTSSAAPSAPSVASERERRDAPSAAARRSSTPSTRRRR